MQQLDPLLPGKFYHIYNHAVGGRNLFHEPDNYEYFMHLYDKHISPVADTFARVLMPNHLHLLVWNKEERQMRETSDLTGFENLSGLMPIHQNFSNLFNAYSKAFNKRLNRHGALFERPFKRKHINSIFYLVEAVLYIHNNPVHHGFCTHPLEYPWSCYMTCISAKPTKLFRDQVLHWFGSLLKFQEMHNGIPDVKKIEAWLEMEAFHADRAIRGRIQPPDDLNSLELN